MNIKNEGRTERRLYGAAVLAAVLFVAILLNVVVQTLADYRGWYFYSSEQYSHQSGGLSDEYLQNKDDQAVKVIFCMQADELTREPAFDLVWQTANQFAETYSFVDVDNVNIFLDPEKVEPYRALYDADGQLLEEKQAITTESVIFATADKHVVFALSDFFFLDSEQRTEAYNGEEAMAAAIRYVLDEERPIVYLTEGHGERYSSAYTLMLVYAGYEVRVIDMMAEELDPRAELLICMYPLYDFERAAEGSGIRAELEKLQEFLERGGSFYLFTDAYAKKPEKLSGLLADWGLGFGEGIIRADGSHALTLDGYTFYPEVESAGVGAQIAALMSSVTDARLTIRDAGVLTLQENNKQQATVHTLLTSGDGAVPYLLGEPIADTGEYPIAAAAVKGEGKIALINSAYATAGDVLQSDRSGNRDFLYAMIGVLEERQTPLGATTLSFENYLLEDLTIGTVNHYTRILVLWVPFVIAAAGIFVVVRRRRK